MNLHKCKICVCFCGRIDDSLNNIRRDIQRHYTFQLKDVLRKLQIILIHVETVFLILRFHFTYLHSLEIYCCMSRLKWSAMCFLFKRNVMFALDFNAQNRSVTSNSTLTVKPSTWTHSIIHGIVRVR